MHGAIYVQLVLAKEGTSTGGQKGGVVRFPQSLGAMTASWLRRAAWGPWGLGWAKLDNL